MTIRQTADAVTACSVCGIGARPLLARPGVWVHVEPRTLDNDLHNGTRDHNAVVRGDLDA
jgi:hypothetical protein